MGIKASRKRKNLSNSMVRLTAVIVIFSLFWPFSGLSANTSESGFVYTTVLFFNDLHGHLAPFTAATDEGERSVGGVDRMAALIKSIRWMNNKQGVRTIVLSAGDILQGTPLSTIFKGEAEIDVLKAIRTDASTVGNHEFDFG